MGTRSIGGGNGIKELRFNSIHNIIANSGDQMAICIDVYILGL